MLYLSKSFWEVVVEVLTVIVMRSSLGYNTVQFIESQPTDCMQKVDS
jgi:hypothetical protein